MDNLRHQSGKVLAAGAGQLVLEVKEEVVPGKACGGLPKISNVATDAAIGAPALGGELLPQAVLSQAKELVLLRVFGGRGGAGNGSKKSGTQGVRLTRGTKLEPKRPRMNKCKDVNILTLWGFKFGAHRLSFMTHA